MTRWVSSTEPQNESQNPTRMPRPNHWSERPGPMSRRVPSSSDDPTKSAVNRTAKWKLSSDCRIPRLGTELFICIIFCPMPLRRKNFSFHSVVQPTTPSTSPCEEESTRPLIKPKRPPQRPGPSILAKFQPSPRGSVKDTQHVIHLY